MERNTAGSLILVAALVLLGTAACKPSGKTIRISTNAHGRYILAEFDVPASFQSHGDDRVINFGPHEMIVKNGLLVVDVDKWEFGIPASASKIELNFYRGILSIKLIQTPV